MSIDAYRVYEEHKILGASPVELVQIMYRAATVAVREARVHLKAGDIALRSAQISKAQLILLELSSAVDKERGGELATRLIALYEYMQRRLTEANVEQRDPPLEEVGRLLETLLEAWQKCVAPVEAVPSAPHYDEEISMSGVPAGVCG